MLKIIKYPSRILKKKTRKIEEITPEILALLPQMETAMEKNQGIGLAAPQIGVSKQIIIVKGEKKNQAFLNPKIEQKNKKTEIEEEGCLSLPGLFLPIRRSLSISLSCYTKKGQSITIEARGLAARIFQHEIDHLQGKLIIDRITPLQRWKIRKELQEIVGQGKVQRQKA
tara:strand:+ start:300 stop:809 length:510 start_codon:yes stop_codon:yes gene_type:complete